MKIDFNGEKQSQPAVRPAQDRIKHARPPRVPVFRILVTLVIFGAIAFAGYKFYSMGTVYTYGVVSSQNESIIAPREGHVENLNVARGRFVARDEVMLRITPSMTPDEADAQARVLSEIAKSDATRNLERDTSIEMAEREVERLEKLNTEEIAQREADYELARLETLKLKEFLDQKIKRLNKLKELFSLDAAIQSDIDTAENEVQLARRSHQQAQVTEKLTKSRSLTSESQLEVAKLQLDAAKKAPVVNTADLERAKFELDMSRDKQMPVDLVAVFEGLVLELEVTNGSYVKEGEVIGSMVQTDDVWIDAFIPSHQYDLIEEGSQAKVYIPGATDPIIGTISEKLGAVVRPPEILQDDLPRQTTTLYARIELPEGVSLLPGLEVRIVVE